jgi:cytochrome c peroxidase
MSQTTATAGAPLPARAPAADRPAPALPGAGAVRRPFTRAAPALLAAALVGACGGGGSAAPAGSTAAAVPSQAAAAPASTSPHAVDDATGTDATVSATGSIDPSSLFFTPLGNGRSCSSCHDAGAGWTLSPSVLAARFAASAGTDPVFRLVDGANSPLAPVATEAQRRSAYSMLLERGVIRIGLPVPASAEFTLAAVDDPYGYASAAQLSLFRRPLPAANLKFVTAIMWDGRETVRVASSPDCIKGSEPLRCFGTTTAGLLQQADSAVLTHAQDALGLTAAQQEQVVGFEAALFNAQQGDTAAGSLAAAGASGGPAALEQTPFHFGINDVFGGDYATGAPFNPNSMQLFRAWISIAATDPPSLARASIARGEQLFNGRRFAITDVPGFNDVLGQPSVTGTCTSCHSTPNVGNSGVPRFMNTGVAAAVRRTPDLPLYTLRNAATGATVQTSDPGLALQTGAWADVGKMKVPGLRGLASRPPYFHDGSAPDVKAVIGFYQRRFNIGLSPQEATDLAAFLNAL